MTASSSQTHVTALAVVYSSLGASETGRTLMAAAAEIARAEHFPVALARCLSNLVVEYNTTDLEKAAEIGVEAVDAASRAGVAVWQDYTRANRMLTLLASGRWEELDAVLEDHQDSSVISLVVNAGVGGFLCAVRGEPFSTPWGDQPGPESDDPSDDAWAAFAEANAAITTGRLDVALERAVHATDTMFELSSVSDDYLHMWPVAVDLALRVDEGATVSRLLSVTDEVAERVWTPLAIAAHRARFAGLVARSTEPEEAERSLRSAVEMFRTWGSPHYRARAEAELGRLLESQGRPADAVPLLDSARTTLVGLGATAWVAELGFAAREGLPSTHQTS